ncbi:MAG: cell division protein ZapA [Bacteriovoracaceae bacterium]|nr:cell division protein ZapA [Bacteriovoracaceae bacterium]
MNDDNRELEFEVLGFKVKFKSENMTEFANQDGDDHLTPEKIVKYVQTESLKIKENFPILEAGQIAVLSALNIAASKLKIQRELKQGIGELQTSAKGALLAIEEISSISM